MKVLYFALIIVWGGGEVTLPCPIHCLQGFDSMGIKIQGCLSPIVGPQIQEFGSTDSLS